jgi:hypothetical protein
MRQLKDQLIATTADPKVGASITKNDLETIFKQLPDPNVKYQSHDRSLPPVGVTRNKRFKEVTPGVWGIVVDIDIEDDVDLEQFKGHSISFLDKYFGPDANGAPDVVIQLDAQYFTDDDMRSVVGVTEDGVRVGSERRRQFGLLETATIVAVTFAGAQFAGGFFKEVGSDLYKYLKQKLSALILTTEAKGTKLEFDFGFDVVDGENEYAVKVRADKEIFRLVESGFVSMHTLQEELRAVHDPTKVETVYARLASSPPYLRTIRVETRD